MRQGHEPDVATLFDMSTWWQVRLWVASEVGHGGRGWWEIADSLVMSMEVSGGKDEEGKKEHKASDGAET